MKIPLSILDLVQVNQNETPTDAFKKSVEYIQRAEALGLKRFWVAEHHNTEAIASAATSVVISYLAAHTKTIRVGAGGVMLPNHSPLVIAEQFGTLESMYPNRIDLGLGRAPGTDQRTMRALRRSLDNANNFPQDVTELQYYFSSESRNGIIHAYPGEGLNIPLWILGSSTFGAQLAAHLGLPYAFASHFAPAAMAEALEIYRAHFKPSNENKKPYAMIGVNIVAAESDKEAQFLYTSKQQSFVDLHRGRLQKFKPPINDIETYWSPEEKMLASNMLKVSIVGSPEKIKMGLRNLIEQTKADELMMVSSIFDQEAKMRSLEIAANAMKSL